MNQLYAVMIHVFQTPFLWSSLGMVVAISMFMSPVYFNGDYKSASKAASFVMGYMFFMSLVFYSHYADAKHEFMVPMAQGAAQLAMWQSMLISVLIGAAYLIGLYLGVKIFKMVHHKSIYKR